MKFSIFLILLILLQLSVALGYHAPLPKTKGFAITAKGDTIRGYFDIDYLKGVRYYKDKETDIYSSIFQKNEDVKSVFLLLKSEKIYNSDGFIEYDYLPKYKDIYRKIYVGKNVYYDSRKTHNNLDRISGNIVIKNRSYNDTLLTVKEISINGTKKLLTDYLNSKYNTHFTYKDFKNPIEVIREIERETK